MADRGLKRLCGACGTKYYDFGKLPIICPSCKTEFTGDVVVKSRRAKSSIVADTVTRAEIERKNREALEDEDLDDETISLDDLAEDEDEDLDIDDLDDGDDDLADLEGDVDIDLDIDKE